MAKRRQKLKTVKTKKSKKEVTIIYGVRPLAKILLEIFKKHIGEENRISRGDLFYKVYNVSMFEINELKAYFMWENIKKATQYCRKYTRCKIIPRAYKASKLSTQASMWYFYVANTSADARIYCDLLSKSQKAMENAKKRLTSAVRNGHHKDTSKWKLP